MGEPLKPLDAETVSNRSSKNLRPGRWEKGESGNPKGSSKKRRMAAALNRLFDSAGKDGAPTEDEIAAAIAEQAKAGNVQAFNAIADRVDGKVPDQLYHAGTTNVHLTRDDPDRRDDPDSPTDAP